MVVSYSYGWGCNNLTQLKRAQTMSSNDGPMNAEWTAQLKKRYELIQSCSIMHIGPMVSNELRTIRAHEKKIVSVVPLKPINHVSVCVRVALEGMPPRVKDVGPGH